MEFVGRKLWVCRNETTGFSVGNFNFGPGPKMKTSTLDLAPASSFSPGSKTNEIFLQGKPCSFCNPPLERKAMLR